MGHCARKRKDYAIGLRIAMDSLRLRWSWRGQMHYDQAKKKADEALAAWNDTFVMRDLPRRDAGVPPVRTHQSLEPPPRIAGKMIIMGCWNFSLEICSKPTRLQQRFQWDRGRTTRCRFSRPDYPDISLGDISGFEVARRLKCRVARLNHLLDTPRRHGFRRAAFGLGVQDMYSSSRSLQTLKLPSPLVLAEPVQPPSADVW